MSGDLLAVARTGAVLAASYNPITAVVSASVAAVLLGVKRPSHTAWVWAVSVLGFGWMFGDGLRVLARTRDVFDGLSGMLAQGAPAWQQYTALAVWAVGGLLIGYLAPLAAGVFVGRRVTHGTGRVSAGSIAVAVSLALSAIVGAVLR